MGIVAILKKLRDEFRSKLSDSQKEEMNSAHASSMVVSDLTNAVENAEKDLDEATMSKQRKAEKKAVEEKQMKGTQAVNMENANTLKEMKTECHEKDYSFQEKQQLRQEEIEAMPRRSRSSALQRAFFSWLAANWSREC